MKHRHAWAVYLDSTNLRSPEKFRNDHRIDWICHGCGDTTVEWITEPHATKVFDGDIRRGSR